MAQQACYANTLILQLAYGQYQYVPARAVRMPIPEFWFLCMFYLFIFFSCCSFTII